MGHNTYQFGTALSPPSPSFSGILGFPNPFWQQPVLLCGHGFRTFSNLDSWIFAESDQCWGVQFLASCRASALFLEQDPFGTGTTGLQSPRLAAFSGKHDLRIFSHFQLVAMEIYNDFFSPSFHFLLRQCLR